MLRATRSFALWLSLLGVFIASPTAAGLDPASAVAPLYAKNHKELAAAVSRDLDALWKRCDRIAPRMKDSQGALDFDPVTNSQLGFDFVKGQTLRVASQSAGHAVVDVTLAWKPDVSPGPKKAPSDDVVRYVLVLENGAWKIDDVRSTIDGKAWSLRSILADYAKRYRKYG